VPAAVIPSNGVQASPIPTVFPDATLPKPGEPEQSLRLDSGQALQNALIHSSLGLKALQAGDRAKAKGELEASINILSKIPESATSDGLRLKLIEDTAALRAALTATSQDGESEADEQDDEADTEETPDLVNPKEEPALESPPIGPEAIAEPDLSKYDVPIELNEQVKAYIQFFQTQTRKRELIGRAFERSGRYLPMMRDIFKEQGLPQDLVNLAYIESAFNYRAFSRAKAMGIWQFIKSTAQRYRLKVTHHLDERRDPEKATRAAARYLKDLYGMFNSWPLALAAYNAGEQKVQRAIDRQGTTDFWSLRLPRETQLFVPAFMAITIMAKDPQRYGFTPPTEKPWEVERVSVPGAIELHSIARVVNVPPDEIRELNAALMRGVTPPGSAQAEVLLPLGTKEVLLANLDQLPRSRSSDFAQGKRRQVVQTTGDRYRVRSGDTLGKIASRHRTSPTVLAGLNGMKVGDPLRVGVLLQLPQGKRSTGPAVASAPTPRPSPVAALHSRAPAPARSPVHIVRRGDTLWGIAKAYAVTPEELRRWNDIKRSAKLQPGQPLRVGSQAVKTNGKNGGSQKSTTAVRYKVKRGDTLWEVARAHDVTPEELRRWNDLAQRAKLRVGQELTIHHGRS
jgi:membrane-bound lytic murein transglycosylase D